MYIGSAPCTAREHSKLVCLLSCTKLTCKVNLAKMLTICYVWQVDYLLARAPGHPSRHSWSKLVHYAVASPIVAGTCNSVFSCGRKLSQKYELTKDFDPFNMCSLCKKHAARDGALME